MMKCSKWLNKNTVSLKGKTVAVSGATGGIGQMLCDCLAYLGANLICLDRNSDKSNMLINRLKTKHTGLNAQHITVDLADFDSVKAAVKRLESTDVDYLIFNAGAYNVPRYKCSTGYNNVFQINFISPYYMACSLSDKIKLRGGRIVAVSSIAHNYSKIDINDIDFSSYKASSKVYGNAKRYLTFALYERFKGENTLSVVHPGITLTGITAHYPKLIFAIIKYPMKIIFIPPQKAALSVIKGIFDCTHQNEWIGPRYFNIWGLPKKQKINTCTPKESEQIFKIANNILKKL